MSLWKQHGEKLTIEKGAFIIGPDTAHSATDVYYLEKGLCELQCLDKYGDEYTCIDFSAGRIFGFMGYFIKNFKIEHSSEYLFLIKAKTPCCIYRISEAVFTSQLETEPLIQKDIILTLVQMYFEVLNNYHHSIRSPLPVKLARLLLKLAVEAEGRLYLPRVYTYEEMAKRLGAHMVTLAKIMAAFKHEGYITLEGKQVYITDKKGLETFINSDGKLHY